MEEDVRSEEERETEKERQMEKERTNLYYYRQNQPLIKACKKPVDKHEAYYVHFYIR